MGDFCFETCKAVFFQILKASGPKGVEDVSGSWTCGHYPEHFSRCLVLSRPVFQLSNWADQAHHERVRIFLCLCRCSNAFSYTRLMAVSTYDYWRLDFGGSAFDFATHSLSDSIIPNDLLESSVPDGLGAYVFSLVSH